MSTILVQSRAFRQKMKTIFAPTAVALFLSACTNTGIFTNSITESLKNEAYATSEFYIKKADQSTQLEERQSYFLLAIRQLIDENKIVEAQNTLSLINIVQLNDIQRIEHTLLMAQLAAVQGENVKATGYLAKLSQAQLSHSQWLRVYTAQSRVAENQNDIVTAVRARIMLASYLSDTKDRQENSNRIWAILRNANRGMLENVVVSPGEIELAGWISLILTYNQNVTTPEHLPQLLNAWKAQYPNHSATLLLPVELQNVLNFQQTQLNNIALLLPLSGQAKYLGETIKKGFDDAKGSSPISVTVFDTDAAPIEHLLAQAKQQGIQMIIGPLLKPRVDSLLASPEVNHFNVLAFNSTLNAPAMARVCYYGLSLESEAHSAAEQFMRDNILNAVVIAPQGEFGQRSSEAFAKRWRQLTNKDADIRFYSVPSDGATILQNGGYGQGTGVYVLADAEQLLEFKHSIDGSPLAGQIAIYSNSRSNSPNNGPDFRLAMEGVKFSEIPLLANRQSQEYKAAKQVSESDFSMMRLYAMGSDAWSVANQFNEFRQIPGYKVSGLTGGLTAGANCNIAREMVWLQYQNGSIVSVN
ncbi:hypothetical protein EV693_101197 [Nicoletella semolina]|uniref:Penicillin-binding protein activator LpoA n=1 Tax=Nicoletella semolina TaxID=271160 RepID=A0A4R2NCT3_9PAST|nr:penicillin-binding protein activator [Nicoletella semolina]MDH2924174.1 penicillin-binding protein [Nicoletella semolina]TCP18930.1 hypothetical protein EV693_101197 [Nicoletella semolina]